MQPLAAVLALVFSGLALAQYPLPTPAQLAWQQHEIMALTHFNMDTFSQPGCSAETWNKWHNSSNPATFAPYSLNVSNWVESYLAVGAKHAVLTAKHKYDYII